MVKKQAAASCRSAGMEPACGSRLRVKKGPGKPGDKPGKPGSTQPLRVRSIHEKAARAVKLKLSCFPISQVRNNKNSKGEVIIDVVVQALQELSGSRRHLPLPFWNGVIKEFNLCGGFTSQLLQPQVEEAVAKDLNSALQVAHHKNPAQRSGTRLLRYLEHAKAPNMTELVGLLVGCSPSPSCSQKMSETLLEGVVLFCGRHNCHEAHATVWTHVRDHFDSMLVTAWQRSQAKGVSRNQFMRTWREALQMYIDMSKAVDLVQAASPDNDAVVDAKIVEELTSRSLIASELFACESAGLEIAALREDIDRRLFELTQCDFDLDECDAFKKIMKHSAESLEDHILEQLEGTEITFKFCDASLSKAMVNSNDQWHFPFKGGVKTTAISLGLVMRMP